jgi:hypothetical protein
LEKIVDLAVMDASRRDIAEFMMEPYVKKKNRDPEKITARRNFRKELNKYLTAFFYIFFLYMSRDGRDYILVLNQSTDADARLANR